MLILPPVVSVAAIILNLIHKLKLIDARRDVWREGFPEADWREVRAVILSAAKDLSPT